jgi:hypothetical protein
MKSLCHRPGMLQISKCRVQVVKQFVVVRTTIIAVVRSGNTIIVVVRTAIIVAVRRGIW